MMLCPAAKRALPSRSNASAWSGVSWPWVCAVWTAQVCCASALPAHSTDEAERAVMMAFLRLSIRFLLVVEKASEGSTAPRSSKSPADSIKK